MKLEGDFAHCQVSPLDDDRDLGVELLSGYKSFLGNNGEDAHPSAMVT